jgi:hypothetical protein
MLGVAETRKVNYVGFRRYWIHLPQRGVVGMFVKQTGALVDHKLISCYVFFSVNFCKDSV